MNSKNIYLVLGASSDIGIALLRRLNKEKQNCLFICHFNQNSKEIRNIVPENDNIFKCYQVDFTVSSQVQDFIDEIKENCGIPTHIVHLPAGKFQYTKINKFKREQLYRELEIQVFAFIDILQYFIPLMVKNNKQKSKIVIMLTVYTIANPPKYMMSYIMAKYTLLGLMKSLSSDYAGRNICINGISPSMVETNFLSEIDRRFVEQNALQSVGKCNAHTTDIIPVILFLLSEDSDYMNGVNLNVSNGNVI